MHKLVLKVEGAIEEVNAEVFKDKKPQPQQYLNPSEVVDHLMQHLSVEDIEKIKSMDKADMIQYHHGFGTSVRNRYALWYENNPHSIAAHDQSQIRDGVDYHPNHPDAVSMRILNMLYDAVHRAGL